MNLVLLEAGCVLTTENRAIALYYIPSFLYKSGREQGHCLVADGGRQRRGLLQGDPSRAEGGGWAEAL